RHPEGCPRSGDPEGPCVSLPMRTSQYLLLLRTQPHITCCLLPNQCLPQRVNSGLLEFGSALAYQSSKLCTMRSPCSLIARLFPPAGITSRTCSVSESPLP